MIEHSTLITYLAVLFGFVLIPGPAVLLTLARASSSGTRVGIATGLGIAAGDIIHTAFAVVGVSAIILTSAFLFSVIKYLGAAYLIYLGLRAIFDKQHLNADQSVVGITAGLAFRQALLTEVLNPKSALFFLAFLPQFVNPATGSVALQLSILGALFVMMGMLATTGVALAAGSVGKFLRKNPAVMRWQGKVVGGIYCALGVRLAFQDR